MVLVKLVCLQKENERWKEALSLTIDKNKFQMQKGQDYCMKMHAVIWNILLN